MTWVKPDGLADGSLVGGAAGATQALSAKSTITLTTIGFIDSVLSSIHLVLIMYSVHLPATPTTSALPS
jgi:hypothetical protein